MFFLSNVLLPVLVAFIGYAVVTRVTTAGYIGPSGYGFSTTPAEVLADVDLKSIVVLITGANAGLGFESALEMAIRGAHIVVTTRSVRKSRDTIDKLQSLAPGANFTPLECDLSDLKSVTKAAETFLASGLELHVLMNNAGVMALPSRITSKHAIELQMATNHIGHFHLTNLLLPQLLKSSKPERPSRIVAVSSSAHKESDASFLKNATFENSYYHFWTSYGNTKLANVLHARELHERYFSKGLYAFSLHPGVAMTELARNLVPLNMLQSAWNYPPYKFLKTVSACASTQVFAATKANSSMAGRYLEDNNDRGSLRPDLQVLVDDPKARKQFWDMTQAIIDGAFK